MLLPIHYASAVLIALLSIFANFAVGQTSSRAVESVGKVVAGKRQVIRNHTSQELSVLSIVPEGSFVEAGDLLLQLDTAPLQPAIDRQHILVNQRQIELQAAEQQRKNMLNMLNNRLKLHHEKLEHAEKELASLLDENGELMLELARRQLQKKGLNEKLKLLDSLHKAGSGSQDSQIEIQQEMIDLKTEIAILEREQKHIETVAIPARRSELKLHHLELEFQMEETEREMETKADQLDASRQMAETKLILAKTELEQLSEFVERCSAVADRPGRVQFATLGDDRDIKSGAVIAPGKPVLHVIDPSTFHVETRLSAQDVAKVEVGQPVRIQVPALGESFSGSVNKISKKAEPHRLGESYKVGEPDQRLWKVTIAFESVDRRLVPGMQTTVTIKVE